MDRTGREDIKLHEIRHRKMNTMSQAVVAHAFNLRPRRQSQVDLCEFEASLIYIASSRTARDTQRIPV